MSLENFYNMEYDLLKTYLYQGNNGSVLLKDRRIKEKMINSPRKYDFIWFVQEAPSEIILLLLDEEGISILAQTSDLEDKMNAIMTSLNPALNTLLTSPQFCSIILNHMNHLASYLNSIQKEGAISFVRYIKEVAADKLSFVCSRLSGVSQCEVLKREKMPFSVIQSLLNHGHREAIEYILKNDNRIVTLSNMRFLSLYSLAEKGVKIPNHFLTEGDFVSAISRIETVKNYRFFMEKLKRENDVSTIEKSRKKFYDEEIETFIEEENMLSRYYQCYQEIVSSMEKEIEPYELLDSVFAKYFSLDGDGTREFELRRSLAKYYCSKDAKELHAFLEWESHLQLTDILIDYHFEEIPFNFFLDLKQLIQFQEGEGKTLSDEEIILYSKLLNLDTLSYPEIKNLHMALKQFPAMGTYYDHFRAAKDKAASLMEQAILTEEKAKPYKDEALSSRAGVDVYVLEGEEFYALVKATSFSKTEPLKESPFLYNNDGGSYSLDGSSKLQTFCDPREYYNFVFSAFPKDQILHMYPVDSYTNYRRGEDLGTSRVYELHTPKDLVSRSMNYSEILFSLPNQNRHDELNSRLVTPKLMGLYCYDKIIDNDIISARNLGIGIVLVKTKSYQVDGSNRLSVSDTINAGYGWKKGYEYLRIIEEDDRVNRRK